MGVSLTGAFLKWAIALLSMGERLGSHSEIHCTKAFATTWAVESPSAGYTCTKSRSCSRRTRQLTATAWKVTLLWPPKTLPCMNESFLEKLILPYIVLLHTASVPMKCSLRILQERAWGKQGKDALSKRRKLSCSLCCFIGWVQQTSSVSTSPRLVQGAGQEEATPAGDHSACDRAEGAKRNRLVLTV